MKYNPQFSHRPRITRYSGRPTVGLQIGGSGGMDTLYLRSDPTTITTSTTDQELVPNARLEIEEENATRAVITESSDILTTSQVQQITQLITSIDQCFPKDQAYKGQAVILKTRNGSTTHSPTSERTYHIAINISAEGRHRRRIQFGVRM